MLTIIFGFIILPLIAAAQIRESKDTVETRVLNEVVIEGAAQYTSANKTTYIPDRNSKRTAQNAADLLSKMAIPQILVGPTGDELLNSGGSSSAIMK